MMCLHKCSAVLHTAQMAESLKFYRDLGFIAEIHDDSIAELSQGGVSFYLRAVPAETDTANAIMIVTVPSLTEWWIRVKLLNLGTRYRVRAPRKPALEPWGQIVGYLYDPSGCSWHFTECAEAVARKPHRPLLEDAVVADLPRIAASQP